MSTPQPVVWVEGLTCTYGDFVAVEQISFSIERGEIFGFLGPNGAGKSTTIRTLTTLHQPAGGTVRVAGFDPVRQPSEVRRRIGVLFQDPSVDEKLTGRENLEFQAMLFLLNRSERTQRIDQLVQLVGLEAHQHRLVRTYSGGLRRRLEIARALIHKPEILFLDEPTVGMDVQSRTALWELLRSLSRDQGTTIFLTTHYLAEAEVCDRVAVMDRGRIVALGTPAELKRQLGGEILRLEARDPNLAGLLKTEFGLTPSADGQWVEVKVTSASQLLPSLLARLHSAIGAIEIKQPTLEDVFIQLTRRDLRHEGMDMAAHWRRGNRMYRNG